MLKDVPCRTAGLVNTVVSADVTRTEVAKYANKIILLIRFMCLLNIHYPSRIVRRERLLTSLNFREWHQLPVVRLRCAKIWNWWRPIFFSEISKLLKHTSSRSVTKEGRSECILDFL